MKLNPEMNRSARAHGVMIVVSMTMVFDGSVRHPWTRAFIRVGVDGVFPRFAANLWVPRTLTILGWVDAVVDAVTVPKHEWGDPSAVSELRRRVAAHPLATRAATTALALATIGP